MAQAQTDPRDITPDCRACEHETQTLESFDVGHTCTPTQAIGAQDDDMIEMHNESGTFVTEAGWVWAECLRESAQMRREAFWNGPADAWDADDMFAFVPSKEAQR